MQKNILLFFFIASTLTRLSISQSMDDDEDFVQAGSCYVVSTGQFCMYPQTATFDALTYKATANYAINIYFLNQDQYDCLKSYNPACVSTEDDDDGFTYTSSACLNIINGDNSIPSQYQSCSGLSEMYDSSASCQGETTCMRTASVSQGSTYYVVVESISPINTINVYWYLDILGLVGFALFSAIFFPIICCCGIAGLTFIVVYNKKGNPKHKRKATTTVVQLKQNPVQMKMADGCCAPQQGQVQMQMGQQHAYMQQQGQVQMQMGQQPVYMQQQGQAQMQMGQQPIYVQENVATQGAVQAQVVYK